MNDLEIIRQQMHARRQVQGEYGARAHLRWLLAWAARPEAARRLAEQNTYPPHPSGGHWAKDGLLAAVRLAQLGVLRARKTHDPRYE